MEPLLLQAGSNEAGQTFFLKNYYIHTTLKTSEKGNVYLAKDYDGWLKNDSVIIKHGNGEMPADEFGRNMSNRLKWQMQLHQSLPAVLKLPKIKEFFRYKFNYYLIMEHIFGTPLRERLADVYQNRTWDQLSPADRTVVLNLLLRVIDVIQIMHDAGFLHRDITPENFLIKPAGQVIMIDLELAHPIHEKHPTPPFALGTAGFMSPEQRLRLVPTVKQDIYGLGALILTAFTNLPPLKFDVDNPEMLLKSMSFLGVPQAIQSIIGNCLSEEKSERPELVEIRQCIQELLSNFERPSLQHIDFMVQRAFKGLINVDLKDRNSLYRKNLNAGLAVPVQGILHLISEYGIDKTPEKVQSFFKKGYENDSALYQATLETELPGLFCGRAGNALGLYSALDIGMLGIDRTLPRTYDWMRAAAPTLDLANGVAGQALAVLLILQKHPTQLLEKKLSTFISILLKNQSPDGSWPMEHLRLADGKAGVLLTLIKCYRYRSNFELEQAITKALTALRVKLYPEVTFWSSKKKVGVQDISLMGGTSGIALVFLYAYEIWGKPKYKETAEKMLNDLPELPYSFDFSLESGLAGIGLVYVQAAKATDDSRWMQRINRLCHLLNHMLITNSEDNIHWNMRGMDNIDASLLSGNAGIIYFLIRLLEMRNSNGRPS
ncbi:MAG: lanthionine synthetase LanC family protein, partial [Pedobacter sp.]|uniref:lanthionine synthetase LanC family protein n=1 Tax=Pedobacter sp. TaxID=1411316 RepID=UPI0033918356